MTDRGWQMECTGYDVPLGMLHEADLKPGGRRISPIFTIGEGHRLIIGPTGSGKFWSAICPMLLTMDHASAIVFDVAGGEAARETSWHRANLGPVLLLDPFALQSNGSGALNPFDTLGPDDGGLLGRARILAEAIMMETAKNAESEYWIGQALDLLTAMLIHVHTWPLETDRTLGRVRDLIRGPIRDAYEQDSNGKDTDVLLVPGMGLGEMAENQACAGFVRDTAYNAQEDITLTGGRNFFYARQTLRQNTAFLDAPEIRRSLATTSMDLRDLREGVGTLYIICPASQLRQLGRWMRLVYATILPRMQLPVDAMRHDDHSGTPLHIVMDEFAAFGPFHRVKDDMATVRKFGIQYHLAAQKVSQLQGIYGKHEWESLMPRYLQILGCDEQATADYVSKRLGTVRKETTGYSTSRGAMGSSGSSESRSEYKANFREPHEISGMESDGIYVIIQGSAKPLFLRKQPAHADASLQRRLGSNAKSARLYGSTITDHNLLTFRGATIQPD